MLEHDPVVRARYQRGKDEITDAGYEMFNRQLEVFLARPFGAFHLGSMLFAALEKRARDAKHRQLLAQICGEISGIGEHPSTSKHAKERG